MKRTYLLIIAICFLPMSVFPQTESQPKDYIECINQIKAWKMSELARMSIVTIAGIRLGGSILSFRKDENTGAYLNSYTGTKCYSPDLDPEVVKREREQYQYQVDREVTILMPLADFDDTGFVSTSEGTEFRNLVEFGYKAAYVISAEEGSIEHICQGLMIKEETFREMLVKYKNLLATAKKLGITEFPAVNVD